jgi:hypothetical protein
LLAMVIGIYQPKLYIELNVFQEVFLDYTRMTKGNTGQAMACLHNLILVILLLKKYRAFPPARCYSSAHPTEA